MPGIVYSTRFVQAQSTDVWLYYAVPPGFRAVVKSVVINNWGGAPGRVQCQVNGYLALIHDFPGQVGGVSRDVMLVAYVGEVIGVYSTCPTYQCLVNGYLLREPPGAMEATAEDLMHRPDPVDLPEPFLHEP